MANISHIAFNQAAQTNDFMVFKNIMQPIVDSYGKLYQAPLWKRIILKIRNLF